MDYISFFKYITIKINHRKILDGMFAALASCSFSHTHVYANVGLQSPLGLVPNYVSGNESTFSDASASAALAAVAYRVRILYPNVFGESYSNTAGTFNKFLGASLLTYV